MSLLYMTSLKKTYVYKEIQEVDFKKYFKKFDIRVNICDIIQMAKLNNTFFVIPLLIFPLYSSCICVMTCIGTLLLSNYMEY